MRIRVKVFSATFNNISVISWWSVLLVEETGENHRPVESHWQGLSQCCIKYTSPWATVLMYSILSIYKCFWNIFRSYLILCKAVINLTILNTFAFFCNLRKVGGFLRYSGQIHENWAINGSDQMKFYKLFQFETTLQKWCLWGPLQNIPFSVKLHDRYMCIFSSPCQMPSLGVRRPEASMGGPL